MRIRYLNFIKVVLSFIIQKYRLFMLQNSLDPFLSIKKYKNQDTEMKKTFTPSLGFIMLLELTAL